MGSRAAARAKALRQEDLGFWKKASVTGMEGLRATVVGEDLGKPAVMVPGLLRCGGGAMEAAETSTRG